MDNIVYTSPVTGIMLKTLDEIEDLRLRWNQLWRENNGISVQCYAYAIESWRHIHKQHKRKVQCAAVFDGDELVAVWPLISNYKGAWKVVRPLGPATAEYVEPLIKLGPNAQHHAELLWQVVKQKSGADLINLPFVRNISPLGQILAKERNTIGVEHDTFHHLVWPEDAMTFEQYWQGLGKNHRVKLIQRIRAFGKVGEVTYQQITEPALMEPYFTWILTHKRRWAEHIKLENPGYWLTSDDYINFLRGWANDPYRAETLRVDLLCLDNQAVAAFVVMVGPGWLEWIIGGYDDKYTKYSPGMILQYHFVKWGFENHKEPDFGIGKEDNKKFWCNNQYGDATIHHIANSPWGKIGYRAFYSVYDRWRRKSNKKSIVQAERQTILADN